ncbi:MAG: hypothetical protein QOG42_1936, partial [Solirubrobacteraceae bacterium]|nr:hypothetical protein [Solirubrobacteraceae bacterium]
MDTRRYDSLVSVRDHKSAMARLGRAVKPHLSGAAERLMADRYERRSGPAARRETLVEAGSAVTFLLLAIALAQIVDAPAPHAALSLALIVAIAIASRVEFDAGAGYVTPVQLVFVPILFVADPAWAPLLVAAGLVLSRLVEASRGGSVPRHALVAIGNAWFAMGPALVLVIAGVDAPVWERWPVYVAALASQFLADGVAGIAREWLVLGVPPRLQLRMMGLVFLVDILLTPVGLLAALTAQKEPFAFLLVLPLVALLAIFARERGTRIDQAIELSRAYRGTALLLGEVIAH